MSNSSKLYNLLEISEKLIKKSEKIKGLLTLFIKILLNL